MTHSRISTGESELSLVVSALGYHGSWNPRENSRVLLKVDSIVHSSVTVACGGKAVGECFGLMRKTDVG